MFLYLSRVCKYKKGKQNKLNWQQKFFGKENQKPKNKKEPRENDLLMWTSCALYQQTFYVPFGEQYIVNMVNRLLNSFCGGGESATLLRIHLFKLRVPNCRRQLHGKRSGWELANSNGYLERKDDRIYIYITYTKIYSESWNICGRTRTQTLFNIINHVF